MSTPTYSCWRDMRRRVLDPKNRYFHRYGGRGIRICERWNSYANFVADMGMKPEGLSLDRIDNDGDYEPGNCRWATPLEQTRGNSGVVWLEYCGERMIMIDWARRFGMPYATLGQRMRAGWTLERALTEPIRQSSRVYKRRGDRG